MIYFWFTPTPQCFSFQFIQIFEQFWSSSDSSILIVFLIFFWRDKKESLVYSTFKMFPNEERRKNLLGNNKIIKENFCTITGNENKIFGDKNIIYGDNNEIRGNMNKIYGRGNKIFGNMNDGNGIGNEMIGDQNITMRPPHEERTLLRVPPHLIRRMLMRMPQFDINEEDIDDDHDVSNMVNTQMNGHKMIVCVERVESSFTMNDVNFVFRLTDGKMSIKQGSGNFVTTNSNNVLVEETTNRRVENFFVSKETEYYVHYKCFEYERFKIIVYDSKIEIENFDLFPKFKMSGKRSIEEPEMPTVKRRKIEKSDKDTPEELICKVCFENKVNTCIIDCGHTCLCSECIATIMNDTKKCPICRKEVVKGMQTVIF